MVRQAHHERLNLMAVTLTLPHWGRACEGVELIRLIQQHCLPGEALPV